MSKEGEGRGLVSDVVMGAGARGLLDIAGPSRFCVCEFELPLKDPNKCVWSLVELGSGS